ncbi:anti-sigma factor family protein [Kribbella sp. CA-293567]|uniref:anti-sigma factor family protein n=1 Tax=Kribbella sp. CA-293567 TaxID=3002436 RepID=UPI0022DE1E1D|nr:zf-HC2 domain-containing protein [Kribbella sp. CA-293567]WBQ07659.1 zf-HC2 domain-containing protein [Kribbella sp. CA-293567]
MSEHDHSRLGAYALGALAPDELREVDQHLSGCAAARDELAEFEELKELLGEVPPEAFLDGAPDDGDLLLQRTLREVRSVAAPATAQPGSSRKRSPWLLAAAAVVLVAGALGGGVLIGRQSVDIESASTAPPAGSKQATATDAATNVTMATTVEPRNGWAWVNVQLTNMKAGAVCEMLVTDRAGKVYVAGSWVISEKAAREGSRFSGGVLVPLDQVKSVEIKTVQGEHVVTTPI